jgi:hypothetical protein
MSILMRSSAREKKCVAGRARGGTVTLVNRDIPKREGNNSNNVVGQDYIMSRFSFIGILLLVCILAATAGCTGQQSTAATATPAAPVATPAASASDSAFNAMPKADLNATETADIVLLQEEAKFAYDLNQAFYGMHSDLPILLNLSASARKSMLADDVILVRYNIPDPESQKAGVFTDSSLQQMYNNDLNAGLSSVADALKTDSQFTEMNIADLSAAIGRTDNQDLIYIYNQQLALARNNLRELSQSMAGFGVAYTPRYITPESYAQIIGSPMEQIPGQ